LGFGPLFDAGEDIRPARQSIGARSPEFGGPSRIGRSDRRFGDKQ